MIRPPCPSCPWRTEATAEQIPNFSLDLAESLAACQSGELGAPLFACHLSREREFICAGWVAVHGRESVGVRIMVVQGDLDVAALDPQQGWPALHASYDEMMVKLRGGS
jgi:hypothetical protein